VKTSLRRPSAEPDAQIALTAAVSLFIRIGALRSRITGSSATGGAVAEGALNTGASVAVGLTSVGAGVAVIVAVGVMVSVGAGVRLTGASVRVGVSVGDGAG
jgi:hypothetical protein